MDDPFENEAGIFLVLANGEGQYSLWPSFAEVPDGWDVAYGEGSRQDCLEFIEATWTDMRPKSLIEQMEGYENSG
jgi:MbtH protein